MFPGRSLHSDRAKSAGPFMKSAKDPFISTRPSLRGGLLSLAGNGAGVHIYLETVSILTTHHFQNPCPPPEFSWSRCSPAKRASRRRHEQRNMYAPSNILMPTRNGARSRCILTTTRVESSRIEDQGSYVASDGPSNATRDIVSLEVRTPLKGAHCPPYMNVLKSPHASPPGVKEQSPFLMCRNV